MKSNTTGFTSVDEYIASFPEAMQTLLQEVRAAIKAAAPDAAEKMSYRMPTFTLKGTLVYFAAWKKHIGLYAAASENVLQAFKDELSVYLGEKGSLKFPTDEPLPLELISQIVKMRAAENLEKAGLKSGKSQ